MKLKKEISEEIASLMRFGSNSQKKGAPGSNFVDDILSKQRK